MAHVLLLDDEPHFLEAHIFALEEAGHLVDNAVTATEGLQKLKRPIKPDVIILDIIMPFSSEEIGPDNGTNTGIDLLEEIRELDSTVPVIVLTVVANQDIHQKLSVIEKKFEQKPIIRVKPFLPSELVEAVETVTREEN